MLERLGYEETPRGEVRLHRKFSTLGFESYELLVGSTFVMDTSETRSERLLATSALERLDGDRLRILVGGLGLGFTVAELLTCTRVDAVDVIELEPALVDWIRADLVPDTAGVLHDPRVSTHVEDVRVAVSESAPGTYDAILLDVDNGPDHLVHEENAEVYESRFLTECARALRPGGLLSVWSSDRAPGLRGLLDQLFGGCAELCASVQREGRVLDYYIYLARLGDA